MESIAEQQIRLFQNHPALLCGAGISVSSGIPSVYPFTNCLLRHLRASKADIELFQHSGFPFEAMMEVLKTRLNIFKMLQVFDIININNNHRIIAEMTKRGWLKLIVTTNFDRNIEAALQEAGLEPDKDFKVINNSNVLRKSGSGKTISVLKIHGSIEDHFSILSTITGVSNKANRERMARFFKKLFRDGGFDGLITWGYSFSDHFDIKPAIREIPTTGQNIYSLRYQSRKLPEVTVDNSANELFAQFSSATDWYCSLDKVVNNMCYKVGLEWKPMKKAHWKRAMNQILKEEVTGKGLHHPDGILAALFQTAGHTAIAKKYAERGLAKCKPKIRDRLLKMDLIASVAKAHLRDPNNRETETAISMMEQAREIAIKEGLSDYARVYAADIGSCYNMLGRFDEAIKPYEEAIAHYSGLMKDPLNYAMAVDRYTGYQINLANCYAKLKDFKKAISIYKKTLRMCKKDGLLANLELCLAGYGLAYGRNNKPEKAVGFFMEGYRLAVDIGTADRIKSQFYLVCSWSWSATGKPDAQIFYDKEYDYVHAKTGMNKTLDEIGPGLTVSLK